MKATSQHMGLMGFTSSRPRYLQGWLSGIYSYTLVYFSLYVHGSQNSCMYCPVTPP